MKNRPVYLSGFMGCGKSTVGVLLARKLGAELIDLDEYIEKSEGMSIPEIFAGRGEAYFRAAESAALKGFSGKGCIVAAGGGALISEENGAAAMAAGEVVFIDTPFEICYDRIKNDPHRPIAAASDEAQLKARYDQRRPHYLAHSTITVDGNRTPGEIADEIAEKLDRR